MTFSYSLRDALLRRTAGYPTGAVPTLTESFDLGPVTRLAHRPAPFELLLTAPVLTAENLPAGNSLKYSLEFCDDPAFPLADTQTVILSDWIQEGHADGVDDIVRRYRISTDSPRYVRVKCTKTGTGGDLAGKSFVFEIVG